MYTFIGLVFIITTLFSLKVWLRAPHNKSVGAAAIVVLVIFFLIGQWVPKEVIRSSTLMQGLLGLLLFAHIALVSYWVYLNAQFKRTTRK